MTIWAIIPVKPLAQSKTRLAHLLSAHERAGLMRRFLQNALLTLNCVPAIGRILVISSDAAVLALARQHGAMTIIEQEARGLNTAVTQAAHYAQQHQAEGLLILPADLPFMQTADINHLLTVVAQNTLPILAICTDSREDGTNALLLAPPTHFTFHYGQGSFHQHLQEAARLGYTPHIVTTPGLQFDLDTEADWHAYRSRTFA
ncbi:MAG: 2-phospho-L-lactate guanylyltransferase [Ardenticatenaceae bacterium]|nr:2-phospho-L-lactate guanylyltransferase [Ardenticatenaceae bacterium]